MKAEVYKPGEEKEQKEDEEMPKSIATYSRLYTEEKRAQNEQEEKLKVR